MDRTQSLQLNVHKWIYQCVRTADGLLRSHHHVLVLEGMKISSYLHTKMFIKTQNSGFRG